MMGENITTRTTLLMTKCLLISLLLLIGLVLSSPVVSGSATTVEIDQEEKTMLVKNKEVDVTAVKAAMETPAGNTWKYCVGICDDQCANRCAEYQGFVVWKCTPGGSCCCSPSS